MQLKLDAPSTSAGYKSHIVYEVFIYMGGIVLTMSKFVISAEYEDMKFVLSGLRRIKPDIKIKGWSLDDIEGMVKRMPDLDNQSLDLSHQANSVQNQREALAQEYHGICKSARALIKGEFDDDAPELEQVGIVRSSQIVRNRRKNKKGLPPAASGPTEDVTT